MGSGGNVSSTTSIPMDEQVPINIQQMPSKSCDFNSGSTSCLVLAISYKYFALILPAVFWPGLSLPFYNPDAFLMNHVLGGGLTTNLKLLSTYAESKTLIGISGL